jgi:hypothetical protein
MRAHSKRISVVAATLTLIVVSGCSESLTRTAKPESNEPILGVPAVELTVSALPPVGGPSQPISIESRAVNATGSGFWHCQGCGCGNGMTLTILGPDGSPVALRDPREEPPLCPDTMVPWASNASVESRLPFTGTLYETNPSGFPPTPTYDAPAGTYTVVARFSYAGSSAGQTIPVVQTTTFQWQP